MRSRYAYFEQCCVIASKTFGETISLNIFGQKIYPFNSRRVLSRRVPGGTRIILCKILWYLEVLGLINVATLRNILKEKKLLFFHAAKIHPNCDPTPPGFEPRTCDTRGDQLPSPHYTITLCYAWLSILCQAYSLGPFFQ